MALTDDEIREKVIKHDYEFRSLATSLKSIVDELHAITSSMKNVAVLTEQISNMDNNLKESFTRVHKKIEENEVEIKSIKDVQEDKGCNALSNAKNNINTLNLAMFGKDGRGGVIFDVEDIKKFMYKSMGFFTLLNIVLVAAITYIFK